MMKTLRPISSPPAPISPNLHYFPISLLKTKPRTTTTPPIILSAPNSTASTSSSSSSSSSQIEMHFNPTTGLFTPRQQKVVVLWDLDNKPPRGPPYPAALHLRRVAELFGHVDTISAYANRHAFSHLPQWVLHQRRHQRDLELQERHGLSSPSSPYLCSVCGRKCKTSLDLKKHFKQLHERERQKKIARMNCLKGKKRQKYKERHITSNVKYQEAARQLLTPKTGYGLAGELKRAGVFVKTVEDKPQAADRALKKQMQHTMARGIDWLFLVSDDSDFSEMVRKAREADLRTVVVGDAKTALGRHADVWVSWGRVESGEVGEEVLRMGRRCDVEAEEEGGVFLNASFYEARGDVEDDDGELEGATDEIVARTLTGLGGGGGGAKVSAFSEEETKGVEGGYEDTLFGSDLFDGEFLSDSEDEDEDDYYIG